MPKKPLMETHGDTCFLENVVSPHTSALTPPLAKAFETLAIWLHGKERFMVISRVGTIHEVSFNAEDLPVSILWRWESFLNPFVYFSTSHCLLRMPSLLNLTHHQVCYVGVTNSLVSKQGFATFQTPGVDWPCLIVLSATVGKLLQ